MHSQPPKSPLSGGLWKLREGRSYCRCLLISLIHHKLLSTDFFTGQILFSGKGLLDILWFLLRNPEKKSLRLAALILQLIPRYTKVSVKRLINLHRLVQKAKQAEITRRYSRVRGVEWWICRHDGCCGLRRRNLRQSQEIMAI